MSEIICGKTMDGARFVVWINASIYVNKTNTLLCELESSAFVQVKQCFLFIITAVGTECADCSENGRSLVCRGVNGKVCIGRHFQVGENLYWERCFLEI